ncbi:hypothetical protein SeLEV6574_g06471 [Synchytrium endobioticum]|uniref:USP domain-containing protein n=1 Tax=Synchytrium endobioticum TaxID=286115 RepID=A0A507CNI7_9FUNG|nr:hypothetical protein SeLEV6574_g06471 [Synchytrium endobioticum]
MSKGLSKEASKVSMKQPQVDFVESVYRILARDSRHVTRGIGNLSNTCFMNSVLQVILNSPILLELMVATSHKCKGTRCGICNLVKLIPPMYNCALASCHKPQEFLASLKGIFRYNLGRQEDACDLLFPLLDALSSDTYRHGKLEIPDKSETPVGKAVLATCTARTITCKYCGYQSTAREDSPVIQLCCQSSSLDEAIKQYSTEHISEWRCGNEKCNKKQNVVRVGKFERLPQFLAFQLKRFDASQARYRKLSHYMSFPSRLKMKNCAADKCKYDLYAIIVHHGSLSFGHYYAYVKNMDGKWHQMDDDSVTQVSEEQVLRAQAYVLCYTKVKNGDTSSSLTESRYLTPDPSPAPPEPLEAMNVTNDSSNNKHQHNCASHHAMNSKSAEPDTTNIDPVSAVASAPPPSGAPKLFLAAANEVLPVEPPTPPPSTDGSLDGSDTEETVASVIDCSMTVNGDASTPALGTPPSSPIVYTNSTTELCSVSSVLQGNLIEHIPVIPVLIARSDNAVELELAGSGLSSDNATRINHPSSMDASEPLFVATPHSVHAGNPSANVRSTNDNTKKCDAVKAASDNVAAPSARSLVDYLVDLNSIRHSPAENRTLSTVDEAVASSIASSFQKDSSNGEVLRKRDRAEDCSYVEAVDSKRMKVAYERCLVEHNIVSTSQWAVSSTVFSACVRAVSTVGVGSWKVSNTGSQ